MINTILPISEITKQYITISPTSKINHKKKTIKNNDENDDNNIINRIMIMIQYK